MTDPKEYGRALYLLAEEEGVADDILSDAKAVRAAFSKNPEYAKLLNTPAMAKKDRLSLLDESLGGVHRHLRSLIKMLAEEHRANAAVIAIDGFVEAYEKSRGIEHATVISAVPLSESELLRLREKLERTANKTFILECKVDPSILGGIKLRYMGTQLDSSLKTKLDSFADAITKTIV